MRRKLMTLADRARDCPASGGTYRLYQGSRLLHVGMAAGAATVRSEVLAHARGEHGTPTQYADHVEWELEADPLTAYRRFLALHAALSEAEDSLGDALYVAILGPTLFPR